MQPATGSVLVPYDLEPPSSPQQLPHAAGDPASVAANSANGNQRIGFGRSDAFICLLPGVQACPGRKGRGPRRSRAAKVATARGQADGRRYGCTGTHGASPQHQQTNPGSTTTSDCLYQTAGHVVNSRKTMIATGDRARPSITRARPSPRSGRPPSGRGHDPVRERHIRSIVAQLNYVEGSSVHTVIAAERRLALAAASVRRNQCPRRSALRRNRPRLSVYRLHAAGISRRSRRVKEVPARTLTLLHATIFYVKGWPLVPSWLNHAARCSLSTLRAVVTFDCARLTYGWWLAFTVPAFTEWVSSDGFTYRLPSIRSPFHGLRLAQSRSPTL